MTLCCSKYNNVRFEERRMSFKTAWGEGLRFGNRRKISSGEFAHALCGNIPL